MGALGGLGNPTSPADYLAHLQAIDGTITVVGTEAVRGVATTHYRGTLDLGTLLTSAARTPEERTQMSRARSLDRSSFPMRSGSTMQACRDASRPRSTSARSRQWASAAASRSRAPSRPRWCSATSYS